LLLIDVGQSETEATARFVVLLNPDLTSVGADDPHTNGEADSGSRVGIAGVKSLEHSEDLVAVFRFDANAIIRN
jgi:hypothetical protein